MKIGFIGLGKMGSRMAGKLANDGFEVHIWNRSKEAIEEFKRQNSKVKIESEKLKVFETIEGLVRSLETPRVIWIMIPHVAVEEVLTEVRKFVSAGDIVIDGGNSFYKDSEKRAILAFEKGYPMMVGGSRSGYEAIKPILDSLSKPSGGHEYFGTGGAGHFVKMVHNGIEYGMMQSIGEGFEILEKSKYKFDLVKIVKLWQRGTIISGFLIDRIKDALEKDRKLSDSAGPIAASGEGEWTVNSADEEGVDVPIIEGSLEFREDSQSDPEIAESFTARVVNALRREFGGHEVKKF